jgi:UDP-N-acetylglucosamine--N-acetylmuramyl-(pentapeptide) pyrophosphoryl-undecaprenol N-acetylglucosamine transferase
MKKKLKVVIAGGGTGGHYYPAVSFLNYLSKFHDLEILYFVTKNRIEEKKLHLDLPKAKKIILDITGLLRPLYHPKNIKRVYNSLLNISIAEKNIEEFKPDLGFLTGGYVCFPVAKALKKCKIPYFLHEQNSIIGITNKLTAKNAQKVFVSFEETKLNEKYILSGNPVRNINNKINRIALKEYGLKDISKRTIVVFGGSLGSNAIDQIMKKIYSIDKSNNYIHITENKDLFLQYENVRIFNYIDNIHELFAISDGVISRAGATSIAEFIFYKIKSALIPWKNASENHQHKNAMTLKKMGLAEIFDEDNIDYDKMLEYINSFQIKSNDFEWIPKNDNAVNIIYENINKVLLNNI